MNIKINGESESLEQTALTISELLKIKDVKMPEMVSVEHNGEMLDRENFDTTNVNDGDEIEFLYFMGGGYQ
ncbi:thiamine biosynthesis protein ThiS [Candidatus Marinamargulisbacteria bacterium SCGC AG-414-C22]|nr:thiamine biosynthesis protein ThiS [Candidatus Marinamargulisbacteria bacterium SCGC AG-414-C22]